MVFGFQECVAVVAYIAIVFMPLFPRTHNSLEKKKMSDMAYMGWRLYRYIMGALLVVTLYFFTNGAVADSWQIITGFTLMIALIVLKKAHCAMRHRYPNSYMGRGMLMLLILGCIVGIFVAMCIEPASGLWPVNVACFAAFVALYFIKLMSPYISTTITFGMSLYSSRTHKHGHKHHHHHSGTHGVLTIAP